jgi:hypothetical protein
MEELRLPWNSREGVIFGLIIAGLSCLFIGGYNMLDQLGYSWDTVRSMVVCLPIIWIVAFFFASLVAGRISNFFCNKFLSPGDSVNARLLGNLVCTVFVMSFSFTFIGAFIGNVVEFVAGGTLDVMRIVENHRFVWPRNFFVAMIVEMFIAQPAARIVMKRMHMKQIRARGEEFA